jgi:hypothetical protein
MALMPVIHRQLKRRQVVAFFQKLPVFLVPKCYVLEIDGRSRSGPPSHSRHLQRMQNKKGRGLNGIMTNNSYLSIVSKDCGPAELLVRARRAGDIEKVFPNAKVTRQTDSDYLYRAILPRNVVKQSLAAMIDLIDYPNFKDSVEDRSLHAAYVSVWCAMAGLQHPPPEIERATHARSALTSKNTR